MPEVWDSKCLTPRLERSITGVLTDDKKIHLSVIRFRACIKRGFSPFLSRQIPQGSVGISIQVENC